MFQTQSTLSSAAFDVYDYAGGPVFGGRSTRRPLGRSIKRALDVAIASASLIVLSPLLLAIALLVKASSRGPVFFCQSRVGFDGQLFRCYKFRTMVCDAEKRLERHLAEQADAAVEWAQTRKLRNDPRVTRIGRALRKSSLDELPQLFNVLAGHMSCVGPRPVVPAELALYGHHAKEYLATRPGLTGIWQVSGRSDLSYADRVALDRYYARRWSLKLDITILLMTVPAVMDFDQTA